MKPDDLRGDVLLGGSRIAGYLQGLLDDPAITSEKIYQWIAAGRIPAGKMGTSVIASKTKLREHFAALTGRAA